MPGWHIDIKDPPECFAAIACVNAMMQKVCAIDAVLCTKHRA